MNPHLFIGCNGNVAAIDVSSGVELWRTKLKPGVLSATNYEDVAVLDHEAKFTPVATATYFVSTPRADKFFGTTS
jgi:outer membrane protein assembly factor BamB